MELRPGPRGPGAAVDDIDSSGWRHRFTQALVVVSAVDRGRGLRAGIATRAKLPPHPERDLRPASMRRRRRCERRQTKAAVGFDVGAGRGHRHPFRSAQGHVDAAGGVRPVSQIDARCPSRHRRRRARACRRWSREIEQRGHADRVTLLGHRRGRGGGPPRVRSSSRSRPAAKACRGRWSRRSRPVCPVVSTDVGGVGEVLRVAPFSRMVDVGDGGGMADGPASARRLSRRRSVRGPGGRAVRLRRARDGRRPRRPLRRARRPRHDHGRAHLGRTPSFHLHRPRPRCVEWQQLLAERLARPHARPSTATARSACASPSTRSPSGSPGR